MTRDLPQRLPHLLPMVGDRGLLLVDARGTGLSEPVLTCPFGVDDRRDLERCYARWNQELDLDAYRTTSHVADAHAALSFLGFDEVVVYGVSYGTHLATEFARAHPESVTALILDSPIPRTQDVLSPVGRVAAQQLKDILSACRQQRACESVMTLSRLAELVKRLDEEAMKQSSRMPPSGTEFLATLLHRLHSPLVLRYLPYLIEQASEGRFGLYEDLNDLSGVYPFSWGVHLSTQCAERRPMTSPAAFVREDALVLPELRDALSAKNYLEYCEIWQVEQAPIGFLSNKLRHPTLIVSGEYDVVTPWEYAQLVASDFERARVARILGVGHGAGLTECGARVILEFLEAPDRDTAPETSCDASIAFSRVAPDEATVMKMRDQLAYRL